MKNDNSYSNYNTPITNNINAPVKNNNITVNNNSNNKYSHREIGQIVYNMPDRILTTGNEPRDVLTSIYHVTGTKYHTFTGFVNACSNKRAVICNIFWNETVYVANHIVVFKNFEELSVGDFVQFDGKIYLYDKSEKPGNIPEDNSIRIIKVRKIIKPDLRVNIHKERPIGDYYIDNIPENILYAFYQKQINRIRLALEDEPYYRPEMIISILQTVYDEDTNDYNMIKNMLQIDSKRLTFPYVKLACFVRYLVYDCGVHCPYTIYTLLCYFALEKDTDKRHNDRFYMDINKFSLKNFDDFYVRPRELKESSLICISNYIGTEMIQLFKSYNED